MSQMTCNGPQDRNNHKFERPFLIYTQKIVDKVMLLLVPFHE